MTTVWTPVHSPLLSQKLRKEDDGLLYCLTSQMVNWSWQYVILWRRGFKRVGSNVVWLQDIPKIVTVHSCNCTIRIFLWETPSTAQKFETYLHQVADLCQAGVKIWLPPKHQQRAECMSRAQRKEDRLHFSPLASLLAARQKTDDTNDLTLNLLNWQVTQRGPWSRWCHSD